MRTGKDRVDAVAYNVPVAVGDVQVRPGDIIFGSDDGVLLFIRSVNWRFLAVAK